MVTSPSWCAVLCSAPICNYSVLFYEHQIVFSGELPFSLNLCPVRARPFNMSCLTQYFRQQPLNAAGPVDVR